MKFTPVTTPYSVTTFHGWTSPRIGSHGFPWVRFTSHGGWFSYHIAYIWSNYSDRKHDLAPKWWFSKGNPYFRETYRLVKYYNLARYIAYGWKNRVAFLRLLKFPKIETCLFFFSMVESADSDDIFLFGGSFSCKYNQNKVGPQKTVIKMGYNPYKWPKINGKLGYNKYIYLQGIYIYTFGIHYLLFFGYEKKT